MAFKHDSKKIECLSLEPVGTGPDIRDRLNDRKFVIKKYLDTQSVIMPDGQQMIDNRISWTEPRFRWIFHAISRVIDPTKIYQLFKACCLKIPQSSTRVDDFLVIRFQQSIRRQIATNQECWNPTDLELTDEVVKPMPCRQLLGDCISASNFTL